MASAGVRLERRQRVAIIVLDRPERRNTFDVRMWQALDAALAALEADLPFAVVVTGAGEGAFCAGMDVNPDNPQIRAVGEAVLKKELAPVAALIGEIRRVTDRMAALPVPILAAVNGLAYGGGAELAMRCDLRVMDPAAEICFSEVRLGLMPDWGGGVALTRLVGPGIAAELILTARPVGAGEALHLGLVNRVSAPGGALAEALDMAGAIAANGPRAVRSALAVIRRTPDLSEADALTLEAQKAVALIVSGECVHGIDAFLSRRLPDFPMPEDLT